MSSKFNRDILDSSPAYLGKVSVRSQVVYILVLCFIVFTLVILPFIEFDITVSASGMIRPAEERTEIRTAISGHVKQLFFQDGKKIKKGDTLISMEDQVIRGKVSALKAELEVKQSLARDLVRMIRNPYAIAGLENPSSKEQLEHYIARKTELEIRKTKLLQELNIAQRLIKDKIIANRELNESQYQYNILMANLDVHDHEQVNKWEQALLLTYQEIEKINSSIAQASEEHKLYIIIAPVSGTVETSVDYYSGSQVNAGETILVISPDASLIAECFLPTREIGFIQKGQPCIFQIDAFNYNQFGSIGGEIRFVADDFTMINNKPSYRVICSLNKIDVELSNGFKSRIKKGMTFRVRFFITRRSAWQLIHEKVEDWLIPE